MASFRVDLKPAAQKDFRKIPQKILSRILEAIDDLEQDPFPTHSRKLANSDRLYRLRVGDYRVIYEVETETSTITVQYVRHRREVYRSL
ncbi:MAG TPA: type II toxin-antitoxin system RelE/ParE family toxin [Thermoanaerobaculia bacterium]|nr:type II toxin-antitoxin system RelE/ParE family toxin [Thermoanaerobaculia bacterium]